MKHDEQQPPFADATGSASWVEKVEKLANQEALSWEPFTQNHDPSFWRALRSAYAYGFMRGFRMRDEMPPNDRTERPGQ